MSLFEALTLVLELDLDARLPLEVALDEAEIFLATEADAVRGDGAGPIVRLVADEEMRLELAAAAAASEVFFFMSELVD